MGLTTFQRQAWLERCIKPSSLNEQDQQARAEDMVRKAIRGHDAFDGARYRIYTKGSYPNNTNVRQDSDVDVVVELLECIYFDYDSTVSTLAIPDTAPSGVYKGSWTPPLWRAGVRDALKAAFGGGAVDSSGKLAINVSAVPGSRPSADVVPSFAYQLVRDAQHTSVVRGSCVYPKGGGQRTVNWPAQQLANGKALNVQAGKRYKKYVRALKNAENKLAADGVIPELPSYFMECLVYNVPASTMLMSGTLDDGFQATLVSLWQRLNEWPAYGQMLEPNELKPLFETGKKWTVEDGRKLIQATWTYLGYGD